MPEYIDCHTHVNFSAFDADRDEVIKRALDANTWMVNVGTQKDTSQSAVDLAEKYEKGVYAIIGIHPIHTNECHHDEDELGPGAKSFTSRGEDFDEKFYEKLASHPKVVALGETGLDYFHLSAGASAKAGDGEETVATQREIFSKHIELVNKLNKPLMLHIRSGKTGPSAYSDVLDILESEAKVSGNAHFFAGTKEETKRFLDLGFYISFTGVLTFTHDYDELVRYVPSDRILSETDAPYVAPVPHRGKRNEPFFVREVAHAIARIKGVGEEEMKKQLIQNAFTLFGLEK